MRLTTKLIALFAVIFLIIAPNLHVANAQDPSAGLLACIASFTLGGGDLDACCTADIIDEVADLLGLPIVADIVNSILGLCCAGNILELEVSCCVEALIGIAEPGEPIISACCGADVILDGNNQANCCAAIPTLELCLCLDPSVIIENPDVCCSTIGFNEAQFENCCALDTYNDSTRTECCNNEPTFGEGTTIQNCCDTPARIEENNLCCGIEVFPEAQVADFVEICCSTAADVAANPACCGTATFTDVQRQGCCTNTATISERINQCCSEGAVVAGDLLTVCCRDNFTLFEDNCCNATNIDANTPVCCNPDDGTLEEHRALCCPEGEPNPPDYCTEVNECETNFVAATCCTETTIVVNEELCCAAGPTPGGEYEVPAQVATCCAAGADFTANEERCCSLGLPADLQDTTATECCSEANIEGNAAFCCAGALYAGREEACDALLAQICTANANGNRPTPAFDTDLCCNNVNVPATGTPYELACVFRACEETFVEATCCVEALEPATAPWSAQCSDTPPTPGGCRSSVVNLQRLNITNINSRGDTNIGILNNPGRRPRAARLRPVREGQEQDL